MDTSIYEYRNGSLWWSRETNSTILNATAGLSVIARGSAVQKHAVSLFFLSCLRARCSLAHVSSSLSRSLSQIHIHIHIHKVCVCVCVCVYTYSVSLLFALAYVVSALEQALVDA